jgi:hypothetical protein
VNCAITAEIQPWTIQICANKTAFIETGGRQDFFEDHSVLLYNIEYSLTHSRYHINIYCLDE